MNESVNQPVDCLSPEEERSRWPVKKSTAFYAFFVIFLLAVLDMADRQILAALFPHLQEEFGFTDSQLGFLASLVNFGLLFFAVPTAYLIDKWSRKNMMAVMTLVWSGATAACAFVNGYAHLAICRFLVGAGEAGYGPAGQAMLACSFPKKYQTAAIAVTNYGMSFGAVIGLMGAAYIASHWGWRHAFGVFAIPGIILAIMCLFMKDFKVKGKDPCDTAAPKSDSMIHASYGKVILAALKTPTLVFAVIAQSLVMLVSSGIGIWMPTYFTREAQADLTFAATLSAIVAFLSVFAQIAGASLIDWLRKRGMTTVLKAMFGVCVAGFICMFLAYGYITPGSALQIALIVVYSMAGSPVSMIGSTIIADLSLPQHRATTVSLMIVVQNLFGMALGPVLIGLLADSFSLVHAILILSFLYLVSGVLYFLASRTYDKDLSKTEKVIVEF